MATYDVVVIGAGPGGYVAALRAAQLGMKTAVVERDSVGGTCLNWGCIPSKALIRNAEVVSLFKNAQFWGVTMDGMSADFGAAVNRSRQVVNRMTRGVSYLFRKNGVDVFSRAPGDCGTHTPSRWRALANRWRRGLSSLRRARGLGRCPAWRWTASSS